MGYCSFKTVHFITKFLKFQFIFFALKNLKICRETGHFITFYHLITAVEKCIAGRKSKNIEETQRNEVKMLTWGLKLHEIENHKKPLIISDNQWFWLIFSENFWQMRHFFVDFSGKVSNFRVITVSARSARNQWLQSLISFVLHQFSSFSLNFGKNFKNYGFSRFRNDFRGFPVIKPRNRRYQWISVIRCRRMEPLESMMMS